MEIISQVAPPAEVEAPFKTVVCGLLLILLRH
jgi:hypothetical protein